MSKRHLLNTRGDEFRHAVDRTYSWKQAGEPERRRKCILQAGRRPEGGKYLANCHPARRAQALDRALLRSILDAALDFYRELGDRDPARSTAAVGNLFLRGEHEYSTFYDVMLLRRAGAANRSAAPAT